MAIIGTFKQIGEGEFVGEINTLKLRLQSVHIFPATLAGENAPSHHIACGRVNLGAAWQKRSAGEEGRDYLSVKLDDPSLPAPIYANLFKAEGETFNLIWSRPNRRAGE